MASIYIYISVNRDEIHLIKIYLNQTEIHISMPSLGPFLIGSMWPLEIDNKCHHKKNQYQFLTSNFPIKNSARRENYDNVVCCCLLNNSRVYDENLFRQVSTRNTE